MNEHKKYVEPNSDERKQIDDYVVNTMTFVYSANIDYAKEKIRDVRNKMNDFSNSKFIITCR